MSEKSPMNGNPNDGTLRAAAIALNAAVAAIGGQMDALLKQVQTNGENLAAISARLDALEDAAHE